MQSNNPQDWNEAIRIVTNEIIELCEKKQHDYGHGNILAFGEKGVLVRLNDKVARLRHLIWDGVGNARNEAEIDSWSDIVGYALIAIMLRRGWFELPLREDLGKEEK